MESLHNSLMALAALIFGLAILQSPKEPQGPASAELRALAAADQVARQFTELPPPEVLRKMEIGDRLREERVRQLLRANQVITSKDLDAAALIMQHGSDPDDYLLARELSILSCAKGGYHSLPARAEDRYLNSIKRLQRFGSQFGWGVNGEPTFRDIDLEGEYVVIDSLRLDFMIAPIALVKEHKMKAFEFAAPQIFKRIENQRDKNWLSEQSKQPEFKELSRLFKTSFGRPFDKLAGKRVMELYRGDKLKHPDSYYHAATILSKSPDTKAILLSNEMAAVAAMRGVKEAKNLFARTWDRFSVRIGKSERYGTITGKRHVSPIVVLEYVLQPLHFQGQLR